MREPLLDRHESARDGAGGRAAGRGAVHAELVDPLADGRWEAFVAATAAAGVFHHRAWLALLNRTFGFPMTACCVVDDSGAIRAGAPLAFVTGGLRRARLTSVPLAHECAPLPAPEDGDRLAAELVHALDELRCSVRMPAELRGPIAGHPSACVSARSRAHKIRLDRDPEEVLRRSRRESEIRPAMRTGLVTERRTDAGALAELHRLRLGMQRRRGLPTEPRRFILGLAHLFDRGLGSVLLLRDGGRPVAGAILLCFNGKVVYGHEAADAVAPRARDRLILEAIRWGCAAGMHTLDLGPTQVADARLREFKLSWGAEETTLYYYHLSDRPPPRRDPAGGTWAGPLIRGGPSIVGRLVGEAQCRWAS